MRVVLYLFLFTLSSAVLGLGNAFAQDEGLPDFSSSLGPGFGFGSGNTSDPVELSGTYSIEEGSRRGKLEVTATIQKGWHIYSQTLPEGAIGIKTSIKVTESSDFKVTGAFTPDHPPHNVKQEGADAESEEFEGIVTFTAPIEIISDVEVKSIEFDVRLSGQACEDVCIQLQNEPVPITFAGNYKPTAATTTKAEPFRAERTHANLLGTVSPSTVKPGDTVTLKITATPDPKWHVYEFTKELATTNSVTIVQLTNGSEWKLGDVVASTELVEHEGVKYYEGEVTWSIPVTIPKDTKPGEQQLRGLIGYQTCTNKTCDRPHVASLSATIFVGESTESNVTPVSFASTNYSSVAKGLGALESARTGRGEDGPIDWQPFSIGALTQLTTVDEGGTPTPFDIDEHIPAISSTAPQGFSIGSLLSSLGLGFLGGLILNVMPCVLPVIGLKIMSFVQQGGEESSRTFKLNLAYSAGILAVFLILAALGVFAGLTWGKQFQSQTFNIVLASVVFVFALSLIGVWEIPIPGFVGTGKVADASEQEGYVGAFIKGLLTTVLATPCTGPFIVPVLSWAFKQHPAVIFATFGAMGLGMASPFLVIGLFPRLVSFLPKPGNWMVTFKHLMGFVLLATVIWILRTLHFETMLPTFTLLFGLWLACWIVGQTPTFAEFKLRARAWTFGLIAAVVCGYLAFGPVANEARDKFAMKYQPRVVEEIDLPAGQYTIMVDFTADW